MSAPVTTVSIQGFRGFLEKVTVPFANGKRKVSVCLMGDNATGKSSFADAVEFFFNPDGTIDRLGTKTTDNKAGARALTNTEAARRRVTCQVAFEYGNGTTVSRRVTGGEAQKLPEETRKLLESVSAPLVLRASEMRSFVADRTGSERYELFSKWVGLERLTEVLDDLTKTQNKVVKFNRDDAKLEKEKDLLRVTGKKVFTWDTRSVFAWVNDDLVAGLDDDFRVSGPKDLRQLETRLGERARDAQSTVRMTELRRAASSLAVLAQADEKSILARVRTATGGYERSSKELDDAKSANPASEVKTVLSAAKQYLMRAKPESCPVCARSFDQSVSRDGTLKHIETMLEKLSRVETAEKNAEAARTTLIRDLRELQIIFRDIDQTTATIAKSEVAAVRSLVSALNTRTEELLRQTERGEEMGVSSLLKESSALSETATRGKTACSTEADEIEKFAGVSWADLLSKVRELREIGNRWVEIQKDEEALTRAAEQFKEVADAIRLAIREHVRTVVDALQDDVRAIYKDLRQNDEYLPEIEIQVPDQKKSVKVEMSLFGVPNLVPSGYLSDSQLNSLGLALFLAAVRRFNTDFRFVVLDDIMSSYDATHRLNLVQVIRKYLTEFQVLIATHDEAFFGEAKSGLNDTGDWSFYKLKPWTLESGVRIAGSALPEDEIDQRFRDGEKPEVMAGLILERLESWLQRICGDSGTQVTVKMKKDGSLDDPLLSELWGSANRCFKEKHRKHADFGTISGHSLLNLPRHAPTSKRMSISNGELQTFWKAFKNFQQFHDSNK